MDTDATESGKILAFESSTKWTIHSEHKFPSASLFIAQTRSVEACLKTRSSARFDTIKSLVSLYINSFERIALPSILEGWEEVPELAAAVERIAVCESLCPSPSLKVEEAVIQIHVYQPSDSDAFEEFSNSSGNRNDDDDTMAASVCELPNKSYEGLWDSLIYAGNIKMNLLDYIHATLVFSDANVDGEPLPPFHATMMIYLKSKFGDMEPRRLAAWASWYREDISMPSSRPKIGY